MVGDSEQGGHVPTCDPVPTRSYATDRHFCIICAEPTRKKWEYPLLLSIPHYRVSKQFLSCLVSDILRPPGVVRKTHQQRTINTWTQEGPCMDSYIMLLYRSPWPVYRLQWLFAVWTLNTEQWPQAPQSPLSAQLLLRVWHRLYARTSIFNLFKSITLSPTTKALPCPTSFFSPFPFSPSPGPSVPYPPFTSCREAAPLKPARGLGKCCKLPQWGLGRRRFRCILLINPPPQKKMSLAHLSPTVDRDRRPWLYSSMLMRLTCPMSNCNYIATKWMR